MRPARGPLAGRPFAVTETGRGKAEHQFDMRSPIVGCKGSSMRIPKGSVFAQPEHRERDSAALDIWRWGRARSTSSTRNWLSRRQIHRFLPHDDTFRGEDDPSAIKMVVSSDCSDASEHSACGVIDQHSTSCI
jgi:hypothetical protein